MPNHYSRSGEMQRVVDPSTLGQAIRRSRKAHGLTQGELAGLAGTGLRFVSELERGKPTVSLDKTLAVLAVLGLQLLLGEAR